MTTVSKSTTSSPAASAAGRIKATQKVRSGLMFLTGVTYKRIPLFRYRKPCQIFVEHLSFYRQKYGFKLHGFVIMPNHFHLLIHLPPHHELAALGTLAVLTACSRFLKQSRRI